MIRPANAADHDPLAWGSVVPRLGWNALRLGVAERRAEHQPPKTPARGRASDRSLAVTLGLMTAPDLDDWSLGRLLFTAARLIEHDWNDWLANHDLTHAGLLALHALQGGPLTQRQLAAANRVEEQTMSRVVARLERAGYVSRVRDFADRRRLVITRTARGSPSSPASRRRRCPIIW